MSKNWKDMSLEEAVAHARTISRQALHIAITTYTRNGRLDIVEQLREVRKALKRERRIEKVGKCAVEAVEAFKLARTALIAERDTTDATPVPGYEDKWSSTSDGRIWSHARQRWLSPSVGRTNKRSKKYYHFISNGIAVHRLVALAHLPNPGRHRNVRHKDGNPANNHVDNLEWFGKILP